MAKKAKSRATNKFCVWADHVRRVYQHVTADTPQQAHDLAKKRVECWDPCDSHDSNGFRLSNEVQDLATDEFIPLHGVKNCGTCGSEIVGTINDSNFCDGECGACEYARYQSQPDLLAVVRAYLAADGPLKRAYAHRAAWKAIAKAETSTNTSNGKGK